MKMIRFIAIGLLLANTIVWLLQWQAYKGCEWDVKSELKLISDDTEKWVPHYQTLCGVLVAHDHNFIYDIGYPEFNENIRLLDESLCNDQQKRLEILIETQAKYLERAKQWEQEAGIE